MIEVVRNPLVVVKNGIELPDGIWDLHNDASSRKVDWRHSLLEPYEEGRVFVDGVRNHLDTGGIPEIIGGHYRGALANAFPSVMENGDLRAPTPDEFWENYRMRMRVWEEVVDNDPAHFTFVGTHNELQEALKTPKTVLVKSIEGLYLDEGGNWREMIQKLYDDGVRNFGLTWNFENGIAAAHNTEAKKMDTGLTPFGEKVVKHLAGMPVFIDVSHASLKSANDTLDILDHTKNANAVVIESHTASRQLNPHSRNVQNEIARKIGAQEGIIGVAFMRPFVKKPSPGIQVATPGDVARHVKYLMRVAGDENVGIGTDYGGMGREHPIEDMTSMEQGPITLYEELRKTVSERRTRGVLNGNVTAKLARRLER